MNQRLFDIKDLMQYMSIGRNSAIKIGKDAGAIVRFGRRVLYDREKIDEYIEEKMRHE